MSSKLSQFQNHHNISALVLKSKLKVVRIYNHDLGYTLEHTKAKTKDLASYSFSAPHAQAQTQTIDVGGNQFSLKKNRFQDKILKAPN